MTDVKLPSGVKLRDYPDMNWISSSRFWTLIDFFSVHSILFVFDNKSDYQMATLLKCNFLDI